MPEPAACSQAVTFDGSSSTHGRPDRSIVSYAWDFGDGNMGSGVTTMHAYSAFGTYTAKLTVTDNNVPAKTDFITHMVTINQGNQPPVSVPGGPYTITEGDDLMLNGSASSDPDASCGDSIASFEWDLDDNGTYMDAMGATPTVTSVELSGLGLDAGSHIIRLRVTDSFGLNSSSTAMLTIDPPMCVPPPSGLIAWYPGDGTANDIQGPTFENGTLVNGATYGTGKVGQAFSFNGVNQEVQVPDSAVLDLTTDFTFDAWVNPAANQNPLANGGIVSKIGGGAGDNGYQFYLENDKIGCQFNATGEMWPGNQLLVTVPGGIPNNAWTHVACTYDHNQLKIYYNGANIGMLTVGPKTVIDSSASLRISGDDNGNAHFNGMLDEVEIFDRALDDTEIADIYSAGSAGVCHSCTAPPSGMTSWYTGEGNADDIGGTNNGTFTSPAFAPGKVGQAFSFDGVAASFITAPASGTTTTLTLDAWIKPAAYVDGDNQPSVVFERTGAFAPKIGLQLINNDGTMTVYIGASQYATTASGVLPLNQWSHVAVTISPNGAQRDVSIILNGSVVGSTTTSSFVIDPGTLLIAKANGFINRFNGLIDEVETFDRGLSPTELAGIFAADSAGKCHTSTLRFAASTDSVNEDGTATFTLIRDGANDSAATVDYTFNSGSSDTATGGAACTAGVDYIGTSGQFSIGTGVSGIPLSVPICDDVIVEGSEDLSLTLSNPTGSTSIVSPSTETVTINDNDFSETTVSVTAGDLQITDANGGTSDDTLTISCSAPNLIVHDPNNNLSAGIGAIQVDPFTVSIPLSSVSNSITVDTLGGNDLLTLDFSGCGFIPSGGILYNGGTQTGSPGDRLVIVGGSTTTEAFDFTNNNDGSISLSGGAVTGTISYTGLEPVSSSISAADVTLNYSTASEFITVTDAGAGQTMVDSDVGGESVTFDNPTGTLTINGGDTGNNTITVMSIAASFPANLTINGGTGNDTVNLNADISFASGKSLDVDLQNDDMSPGTDAVFVGAGANLITSGAGTITVKASENVRMGGGSSLESVNGAITVEANQQMTPTTGNFIGVDIGSAVIQSTGTGTVTVKGKGGTLGGFQYGVRVSGGGAMIKGGNAAGTTTTVVGAGGAGTGATNVGVIVAFGPATIDSYGGNVSVTGTGGTGASGDHHGVRVFNAGTITAGGSGTVTVFGTGGGPSAAGGCFGVDVRAISASITSSGGAVDVTGQGGTCAQNVGVVMTDVTATITSGSTGSVTVTGTGGTGGMDNEGINMNLGAQITSGGSGNVTVKGTGGSGNGSEGVVMTGGASNPSINSGGGTISVTGVDGAGTTSEGIRMANSSVIGPGGPITLRCDTVLMDPGVVLTDLFNSATIIPYTNGRSIDIGGPNSPTALGLTDAELDRVMTGTINIGDANSGAVTVSSNITRSVATAMTIASGANIDISGGSLDSNGGNVTLQPGTNVFPSNSGVDVTTGAATTLGITSGKDLKILINGTTPDSGYTQLNVAGLVDVTGVNLNLAGSSLVPAGGESFTIVENDGADAVTGTFTGLGEGAMIANFLGSGLVATVTYLGGDGNDVVISVALPQYLLSVTPAGTGTGTVTSVPTGINCGGTCSASYDSGTVVTLTATPDASSNFTGWSGACAGAGSCMVTMDMARSVTATFTLKQFTLNYTAGANGSLTGSTSQMVNYGDDGTAVTANADSGFHFVDWSPGGSTANPRTDTNVMANALSHGELCRLRLRRPTAFARHRYVLRIPPANLSDRVCTGRETCR